MSNTDRHPLNKLSSKLFYDMLEMREKMQDRILKKMDDENSSTEEIISMIENLITIHELVSNQVNSRLIVLNHQNLFDKKSSKK